MVWHCWQTQVSRGPWFKLALNAAASSSHSLAAAKNNLECRGGTHRGPIARSHILAGRLTRCSKRHMV
eukprot:CAMPEP_0115335368 /NCGR_PEP_ID=MMETSP0270-20121206/88416_1 /TAXON_ID=71861 /ORGANISM="Scrippsiella trochoidea, Strain CCMP3099" /LENGTH=67 /DNA_ID=CAMNT_0002756431 /DNA_START=34 /DNA_END=234 /DNA_ORIENTATION=-